MLAFTAIIGITTHGALAITGGVAEVTNVVVKPGEAAHFTIQLNYTATEPVSSITYSLGTKYLPEDWITRIWYEGQQIRGLTIKNKQVLDVGLEIDVPKTAEMGNYSFWFLAIGQELYSESIILDLQVDVNTLEREIEISCDHPSVGMDSDGVARFTLTLNNIGDTDEWLNLTGRASKGWEIAFMDQEGRTIYEAYLPTQASTTIQVGVTPPVDVLPGVYGLCVGAGSSDSVVNSMLDLKVVVTKVSEGVISALYPELSEEAGKTLTFPITLKNLGRNSLVYRISTSLPSGWTSSFRTTPGGTTSITSVTLGMTESTELYLEVVTPNAVEVGTYTIPVQVVSDNGATYVMDLKATIIGSYEITIEPSTLLTTVVSGQSATFTVQITNTGHTAISGVTISTDVPTDWESSITPVSRDLLQPLESDTFTEVVTTTSDTVAGDYLVTLTAISDQVNSDSVQVRVTVTTPTSWGMWGFGVAIAMVIILAIVFLRLRRR